MQSFYESAAKNPLAGSRRLEALDTMAENKLVLPHPTRRGFFNFDEELSSFTEAPPRRIGSHRQGPADLRAVVCRSGSRDVEQRQAQPLIPRRAVPAVTSEAGDEGGLAGRRLRSISF